MASAMSCLLPTTASVIGYLKTGEWGGVGFEQTPSGSATDCLMDLLVTIATDNPPGICYTTNSPTYNSFTVFRSASVKLFMAFHDHLCRDVQVQSQRDTAFSRRTTATFSPGLEIS